jgi:polysaccharide export outer membrane protein
MNHHNSSRVLGVLACFLGIALALSACSSSRPLPASLLAQKGVVEPTDYRIGAGDQLRIFVWRNEELSAQVVVRPDGRISMPLVDDMVAEGKTPTELARDLEKVLADYVRSPEVNVIVQSFVGTFNDQIRVIGQAVNPRAISYRAGMTILDVLLEVGGLRDRAAANRVKVLRKKGTTNQEISVKLDNLLSGDLSQNIAMIPGDVVVIPTAVF